MTKAGVLNVVSRCLFGHEWTLAAMVYLRNGQSLVWESASSELKDIELNAPFSGSHLVNFEARIDEYAGRIDARK